MSNTYVELKTMAKLQEEGATFYIDAYQRGYRWSQNEVRDLLDDIREFSHVKKQDDGTFYCLQPIIITRNEDGVSWKVIDGQQRLTTLYLIYSFYWVYSNPDFRDPLPFEIKYDNKTTLQNCLKTFTKEAIGKSEVVDQKMADYEKDIDCHYVLEAYKCICDYFNRLRTNLNTKNEINRMKAIFDEYMQIIWYEIKNCDVSTEVAVFSRINMGKIALTNAELIKALLLKKEGKVSEKLASMQMNIAVKWDEIEAQLSEEDFWCFLVNEKGKDAVYATRIDFIFHVMARELNEGLLKDANSKYQKEEPYVVLESVNKDKFSFYVFSNYVRLLEKHPEENPSEDQNYIEYIWDGVCEYYRMFKDWYKNIQWYHMIGFLVDASKQNYIDQILVLSKLYREGSGASGEGHKKHFEKSLRRMMTSETFGRAEITSDNCRELISGYDYEKNADSIRRVLLLYNIAYLESCEKNGRFPFEKYKDKKIMWDLEHINAVADTRPDDDRRDSEDNNRLQWLKRAKEIPEIDKINTPDGRLVIDLIDTIIDRKYYLSKAQQGTKDFIQVSDAVIHHYGGQSEADNSIGNITLLDCGTNRSYKNDVFPLKRKTILDRTMKDVFIPICTKNVFLKGFAESRDLLRWSNIDKKSYTDGIISCICKYLKLEGEINA